MADDRLDGTEFRQLYERFTTAFENEDDDALLGFYAPTAVMIGPSGNILRDRDAIIGFLQRAQRIQSVRFDPTDTRRLSDGAVRQVGDMTLTVRGQGRETRTIPGAFLAIWSERDGRWQIDTCVWSRRPEPQGARAGGGRGGRGMGGPGMGGPGRGMGGGRNMGGAGGGRGAGAGRGLGGGRQGGRGADDVDGSSEAGEGGTNVRPGRRPARGEGGAFNPRNPNPDRDAPLIPRLDR